MGGGARLARTPAQMPSTSWAACPSLGHAALGLPWAVTEQEGEIESQPLSSVSLAWWDLALGLPLGFLGALPWGVWAGRAGTQWPLACFW